MLAIEFPHHIHHMPFEGVVPHERRRQGLLVVCAAMFISAVDMTIVNVALPAISEDLNAGVGELQWVIDAFLVSLAGLLLVGSGLADRFGRRRVFLSGMAAFAAASVLCALAPSPATLIGARALMGAAAACVLPPALSLIAVMFPPEERAQALGVWAAVAGVGLVVGPVLGGLLVREVGWEAVFLVNVPVAVVVVPVGRRVLPESTRPGTPPIDLAGVALSIVALGGIVFALIEGPDAGWASPEVLAAGACGVVAGVLFVRTRAAAPQPAVRRPRPRAPARGGRGAGDPVRLRLVHGHAVPAAPVPPVRAGPLRRDRRRRARAARPRRRDRRALQRAPVRARSARA